MDSQQKVHAHVSDQEQLRRLGWLLSYLRRDPKTPKRQISRVESQITELTLKRRAAKARANARLLSAVEARYQRFRREHMALIDPALRENTGAKLALLRLAFGRLTELRRRLVESPVANWQDATMVERRLRPIRNAILRLERRAAQ